MGPSPPRIKKEDSGDAEPRSVLAVAEAAIDMAERAPARVTAKQERRAAKEAARAERVRAKAEAEAKRQAEEAERKTAQAEADAAIAAAEAENEALLAKAVVADPADDHALADDAVLDDDVEDPAVEDVEDPVVEDPVVEDPVVEDSVLEGPIVEDSAVEDSDSAVEDSTVQAPVVEGAPAVDDVTATSVEFDPMVEPPPSIKPNGDGASGSGKKRLTAGLLGLGALGLICSVILAVGALLTALEAGTNGGVLGAISNLCDVLVGPLGSLFSFSGENAAAKGDLVARGVASIVYLAIGLSMPALARRREA